MPLPTCPSRRLFAQVDCRREMRPMAFLDPGAFELTRCREGRCGMGFSQALLAV